MSKYFRNISGDEEDSLWIPTNVGRYASTLDENKWIDLDARFARVGTEYTGVEGSVIFVGADTYLNEDNANYFWDDTNNRLGIGLNTSLSARLHIKGSGSTSSTNSLLVENSAGSDFFWIQDDGPTIIRTSANHRFNFNNGNIAIIDDSGIIRATTITAQQIIWNYCNFITSNLSLVTNSANSVAWDLPLTTANYLTGTGTTKFMYVRPTINQSNIADFIAFHYNPTVTAIGGRHYVAVYQSGDFVLGASSAVATATMQIDSITKGFLPPRMTTAQRNAISAPEEGLEVYDLTLHKKFVYDGTTWQGCW